MGNNFWVDMHGGVTHFPVALIVASILFDLVGYSLNREPHSRDLHAAAYYALLLGALASFGAVLSGLMMTHWQVFGSGTLAKHHDFVWPAFALIVGLAVWRLVVRDHAPRLCSVSGLFDHDSGLNVYCGILGRRDAARRVRTLAERDADAN